MGYSYGYFTREFVFKAAFGIRTQPLQKASLYTALPIRTRQFTTNILSATFYFLEINLDYIKHAVNKAKSPGRKSSKAC